MVGESSGGEWFAFESKGRSSPPSLEDKNKAKLQAQRLVAIGSDDCALHVGAFTFFRSGVLEFYWRDPEPGVGSSIDLPPPEQEWRYYFEPALSLAQATTDGARSSERERADVEVSVHPKILALLEEGLWLQAHQASLELQEEFRAAGYFPDGLRVTAGGSWSTQRFAFEQ